MWKRYAGKGRGEGVAKMYVDTYRYIYMRLLEWVKKELPNPATAMALFQVAGRVSKLWRRSAQKKHTPSSADEPPLFPAPGSSLPGTSASISGTPLLRKSPPHFRAGPETAHGRGRDPPETFGSAAAVPRRLPRKCPGGGGEEGGGRRMGKAGARARGLSRAPRSRPGPCAARRLAPAGSTSSLPYVARPPPAPTARGGRHGRRPPLPDPPGPGPVHRPSTPLAPRWVLTLSR